MTDINYDEVSDEAIRWVFDLGKCPGTVAYVREQAKGGSKYNIALMHHAYLVQTFTPEVLRDRYEKVAIKVLNAWASKWPTKELASLPTFKDIAEILKAEFAERGAG